MSDSTDDETQFDEAALRTDGGEQEMEDEEEQEAEGDGEEQEAEGDEEEQEAEGDGEEQEGGDRRSEDMSPEGVASRDEGTDVAFLNLQGLNLNVLGLDVELSELVLDVEAVEGDGNLLGNLLSSVAGLLDGGLGSLLDGLGMDFDIGEKLSSVADSVRSALGDAFEDVPMSDILTQVLTGVISQALGLDSVTGDDESEEGDESEEASDESEESTEEDEGNEESEE
ncbi:hypothetical protein BRC94_01805 [Halobacteriales archaeon QS_5_70_17]|nr:MAG: hypothetical protein BRC94_01805 [Halobacteriales archaeon QS_5_70_17]